MSTKERVPLLAMVPRHCTSSSFDMPIPLSVTVSVPVGSSHVTLMLRALPEGSAPCCRSASLSFSKASLAFDTISLINTSLSEYSERATISSSCFVSAWNANLGTVLEHCRQGGAA